MSDARTVTNGSEEPVILISDKDDTLVGKINGVEGKLLDEGFTTEVANILSTHPNTHFAIASKGGNQAVSAAHGRVTTVTELIKESSGIELPPPLLPQITGVQSLVSSITASNVNHAPYTDLKIPPKTYQNEELQRIAFQRFCQYPVTIEQDQITALDKTLPGTTWTFKFGETLVEFSADVCNKHGGMDKHLRNGDFKFFSILMALDSAKLKLDSSDPEVIDKLKSFGIVNIQAPDDYQKINPKKIIFLDDNYDNVRLIQEAGFTCIHADTPALHSRFENEGQILEKNISEQHADIKRGEDRLRLLNAHQIPKEAKKMRDEITKKRNDLRKKIGFDPEDPKNEDKRHPLKPDFAKTTTQLRDLDAYKDIKVLERRRNEAENQISTARKILAGVEQQLAVLNASKPNTLDTYQQKVVTAMRNAPAHELTTSQIPQRTPAKGLDELKVLFDQKVAHEPASSTTSRLEIMINVLRNQEFHEHLMRTINDKVAKNPSIKSAADHDIKFYQAANEVLYTLTGETINSLSKKPDGNALVTHGSPPVRNFYQSMFTKTPLMEEATHRQRDTGTWTQHKDPADAAATKRSRQFVMAGRGLGFSYEPPANEKKNESEPEPKSKPSIGRHR